MRRLRMVPQTFTVNGKAQTISFGAIAAQKVGTPLTLSATASSGLAVSFTSTTTSVCTVSGTTATFIASGTCTIDANQAGNSSYAAAAMAPQTFVINNPAPALTSVSPTNATTGGPAFTLTANGSNFVNGSVVRWNANSLTTTYVSATQLTAQVPASDIATSGTGSVIVFTPTPGGGSSTAQTVTIGGSPVGSLEAARQQDRQQHNSADGFTAGAGWVADPTDGAPLSNVKVYIDGNLIGTPSLGLARPDVAAAYKNTAYTNSGYQLVYSAVTLSTGTHAVTVVAIDSGGRSTTLGPGTITVTGLPPFGSLDQAVDNTTGSSTIPQTDSLLVRGSVADPVDGAPLSNVKVYIDGNLIGAPSLGLARPDVAAAYKNTAYTNSGYQLVYSAATLSIGTHAVTVVAIDSVGRSTTLGPGTVNVVAAPAPFGSLDQAVDSRTGSSTIPQTDSLLVRGWVADPTDGASLSNVKVYIDGTSIGTPTLGLARPDVAAAYNNAAYTNSGYQLVYSVASLSPGTHAVTVVAIDSGGRSTTLGPLTITVTGGSPVGSL